MKYFYLICRYISSFLVACLILSGCATIFHGATEKVDINSVPRGAQVYVNGENKGTAPIELILSPRHSQSIEFRKDGYKNKTKLLESSVGLTWILLDIFGCPVSYIVDASTGDWYTFDQEHVVGVLEKEQSDLLPKK